jgi:MEDS: MEthanogen/methylotroph, DcmR Sensory domain
MVVAKNHSVHIYSESRDLILHLAGMVTSSLLVGHAVLIVATEEHHKQLTQELLSSGIDVQRYWDEGLYNMADAAETLSRFMRNDSPVPALFHASVGQLLRQVGEHTRSNDGSFTVFGEMVALLWEKGNQAAALQLEVLWNEALHDVPFRLHCGYPKSAFNHTAEETAVADVHSCVLTNRQVQRSPLPISAQEA